MDLRYANEHEIEEVVRKFERCEFALEEFTHARHLTVACWYLCTLHSDEALGRMREGLQRFIAHHQKQGYHETITRFWMELLQSYLGQCPAATTLTCKVNCAIERFPKKDILFSYYTRERALSDVARATWVAPDLRPIRRRRLLRRESRISLHARSIDQPLKSVSPMPTDGQPPRLT